MKVETSEEVKAAFERHGAERLRRTDGLTALQRQAVESGLERFPSIECTVTVFDVWPGKGTPYPHPLCGGSDATALVTGFLRTPQRLQRWWHFGPDPVRAIVVFQDEANRQSFLRMARGQEIFVRGHLTWLDEFEYLINGGHNCFGESVGSRFTFRIESATLLNST